MRQVKNMDMREKKTLKNKYIKLQYKIIGFFIIGVIIPMFCVTIATSYVYKKNLEESTIENASLLSALIESNVDTYLDNISQIALTPYYDSWIQSQVSNITLHEIDDYGNDIEINQQVSDFLFNMIIQNKYICSIFITDLDGEIIYAKSASGAMESDVDFFEPYIQSMEDSYMVIPTHEQVYLKHTNQEVFSYVRIQKEVTSNTPIGYIVIEIKASAITEIIDKIDNNSGDLIAIYLEDGSLLKSNITDVELEEKISTIYYEAKNIVDTNSIVIDDKEYLISYADTSDYGITAVIFSDETEVFSVVNHLFSITQFFIFLILLVVFFNTIFFAKKLTNPFNRLIYAMSKVEKGDFKVQVSQGGYDEVGKLIDSFNDMIRQIDELILNEYRLELEEKQTEIKALQNQINPHFLYNTLESIAMMAEINEDVEVAQMVTDLGDFFRFIISDKSNQIVLVSELEYVKTYVKIQNIRYSNRIHIEINCPSCLENKHILKLCIQPLVENSITHGYKPKEQIEIKVNIVQEADGIRVEVCDHGDGMTEEGVQNLKEKLELDEGRTDSIGLQNVHKRLTLTYGSISGIQISSREAEGMKVWFIIPDVFDNERKRDSDDIIDDCR